MHWLIDTLWTWGRALTKYACAGIELKRGCVSLAKAERWETDEMIFYA